MRRVTGPMALPDLRQFVAILNAARRDLVDLCDEPSAPPQRAAAGAHVGASSVFAHRWMLGGARVHPSHDAPPQRGYQVEIAADLEVEIEGVGGTGKSATVYRARDAGGRRYALKIAHSQDDDGIRVEQRRYALLADYGVCRSPVVAGGSDYVLKPWIEGELGTRVLMEGARAEQVRALARYVLHCAGCRVFIHDFKPRNLVFSPSGEWYCIDPGEPVRMQSPLAAWRRFEKYVLKHWCGVRRHHPRYLLARLRARRFAN